MCSNGACVTIAADHPLITCVTFDEGWNGVQGSRGLWVLNEGVTIANTSCVYKNCGVLTAARVWKCLTSQTTGRDSMGSPSVCSSGETQGVATNKVF